MTPLLALIDADSLVYQSLREPFIDSLSILNEKINNIVTSTNCTHISLFLSGGNYFRNTLSNGRYKSNRKDTVIKAGVKTLKTFIKEFYPTNVMDRVEADDLVAYWYNTPLYYVPDLKMFTTMNPLLEIAVNLSNSESVQELSFTEVEKVICSPDKDLLKGIPGKHFNYTYRAVNEVEVTKGFWVETTEKDAEVFLMKQMVVGDSADGISGIAKKGEVFWKNFYSSKEENVNWGDILNLYIQNSKEDGIDEFIVNYKMLYTLKNSKDFLREVGIIPTDINIKEIPTATIEDNIEVPDNF